MWYKSKDVKKKGTAMREKFWRTVKVKELDRRERERLLSIDIEFSDFDDHYILPGFTDVHVHLREPGFLYKETVKSGTMAAAAGGFTDIFSMPNLDPCPDSPEHLDVQMKAVERDAQVRVHPFGAITKAEAGSELADMEGLAPHVWGFSDDGKGVMADVIMEEAMRRAAALGKVIVAHCEDERFPKDSAEAEWRQLERDLELVRKTGCMYHMCHVSTRESVELIRKAKADGLDVTCETAPHYLVFSSDEIQDSGRFKMNPPIKGKRDREALTEAVADGTIDMIATDHAPHSREEKSGGFAGSAYGITGLETAFPVVYTKLVLEDIISMERLTELMYINPGKRFGLPVKGLNEELCSDGPDFTLWDLDTGFTVDSESFFSKGKSTPFDGMVLRGRCDATVAGGKTVWKRKAAI